MKIILPKTFVQLTPGLPVFFLAGPVRGGDDWQFECCKEIRHQLGERDFYVAIPYYHKTLPANHPAFDFKVTGDENHFERQLNWERYYLEIASTAGSIIFWLPTESKADPRPDGGYATDTRGEIGEWRGRLMHDKTLKVVVGGESDFPSIDQIHRNFQHAVSNDFPLYPTLQATVAAAIEKFNNRSV